MHPSAARQAQHKKPTAKRPDFNFMWNAFSDVAPSPLPPASSSLPVMRDYVIKTLQKVGDKIGCHVKTNFDLGVKDVEANQGDGLYPLQPIGFTNACATRLSYVLNKAGVHIPANAPWRTVSGADKLNYIYTVKEMKLFLSTAFGQPDIEKRVSPQAKDFARRQGIIVFNVHFSDATGHATLWNGTKAADQDEFQSWKGLGLQRCSPLGLPMKPWFLIVLAAPLLLAIALAQTPRLFKAPASIVGSGQDFWLDSGTETFEFQVNVGTLHQVNDEIRATYRRKLTGDALEVVREQHRGLRIPNRSEELREGGIVCGANTPTPFTIKERITSPNGKVIFSDSLNPAKTRRAAETMKMPIFGYGNNAGGLVCWTVARKCEAKDIAWPPKDGTGPEYVKQFVPRCSLTSR